MSDRSQSVETVIDLSQSFPGKNTDGAEQANQDQALQAQPFGAGRLVDRHQLVEPRLNGGGASPGHFDVQQPGGQKIEFERAGNQQGHEDAEEEQRPAGNATAGREGFHVGQPGDIALTIQRGHDHPDADAKGQGEHDAGNGEVGAKRHAGIGQRQDVGGRGEEQEGDGRPQPGALFVDAGKQRLDGARANGEQAAGPGRGRIGHPFRGIRTEKANNRLLRHQRGQRAGDEEGRHQAEQDVGSEIGSQAGQAAL